VNCVVYSFDSSSPVGSVKCFTMCVMTFLSKANLWFSST
jgi:hypothetical protein